MSPLVAVPDEPADFETWTGPSSEMQEAKPRPKPTGFTLLDPRQWKAPAKPREWIVQDWIPRGLVTAIYGDGGVGKSLLGMQLMSSVALGRPWLGLDVAPGRALGILCEDDEAEIQRRQEAINRDLKCGPEVWHRLRYCSRLGEDNILMKFDGLDVGQLTAAFAELETVCDAFPPDLLFLDTIADFFGGNEINRSQVRQFVQNCCGRLARKYNCAAVLSGHPSANGMTSGSGTSGSTAWSNTVRSRMYLTRPEGDDADPDARLLSRKKANHAARDADISIVWDKGAFRLPSAEASRSTLPDWAVVSAMLDMIEEAWRAGKPWSSAPQTRETGRYFPLVAAKRFGIPEKQVKHLLTGWMAEQHVRVEEVDKHSKKTGLQVVYRFDRSAR